MRIRHQQVRVEGLAGGYRLQGSIAFTIIELMLAIAIFSMVLTAIYSTWSSILRASRAGNNAAEQAQRSRIASTTIQQALLSAVMFSSNRRLYTFEVDNSGDFTAISFVARLPDSFPGSGYFGDQPVRRLSFTVEKDKQGENALFLRQSPLLQTNTVDEEDLRAIVLARQVKLFGVEFWDNRKSDWVLDWIATNQLPKIVRLTMAFGVNNDKPLRAEDVTMRVVLLPSVIVQEDFQVSRVGGAPGPGGQPGAGAPPGSGDPGAGPRDPGSARGGRGRGTQ